MMDLPTDFYEPILEEASFMSHRVPPSKQRKRLRAPKMSRSKALQHHTCQSTYCAVLKVFNTAELLEQILLALPVASVLRLRHTNKMWKSALSDSPILRPLLFLYPDWSHPATELKLLKLNINGVRIRRGKPVRLGHWIEIEMTAAGARNVMNLSPHRGSCQYSDGSDWTDPSGSVTKGTLPLKSVWQPRKRLEADPLEHADRTTEATAAATEVGEVFLTQPPLRFIHAYKTTEGQLESVASEDHENKSTAPKSPFDIDEDDDSQDFPPTLAEMGCDAGITLGFLADTTETLLRERWNIASKLKPVTDTRTKAILFRAIVSYNQTDTAPRKRSNTRTVVKACQTFERS